MTVMFRNDLGYMRNKRLRQAGTRIALTAEQITEYKKCSKDPIHFIENYIKIITQDYGLQPFKLWKKQKQLIKTLHEDNRVLVKWSRQTGKTNTIAVGYLLWYAIFNADKMIGILANKAKTATEIVHRIKNAYEHIPLWLQQGVTKWNAESIEFENKSIIMSESTSSGAIRGFTFNILYLDEFAFVPNNIAHDFLTSVYPTIASGKTTKIFVSSTPRGMNHFYKMYTEAKNKDKDISLWNGFEVSESIWSDRPDRDAKWAEHQKHVMTEEKFLQEYECEFLGSAGTLISAKALRIMSFKSALKDMLPDVEDGEGKLQVYTMPDKDHSYIITADTSYGKELDYSSFIVFDVTQTPYTIAAKYKSNLVASQLYPNLIYQTGKHYNDAFILVENNDIGAQVLQILVSDLEYLNLFYSNEKSSRKNNQTITISPSAEPGLRITPKTKRQGCLALKSLIENGQIIVEDFDIISELSTFIIHKNGTYAADQSCNDDLVSCLYLFAYLTTQTFFKDLIDQDMRKIMFAKRVAQIEQEMPPMPVTPETPRLNPGEFIADGCLWTVDKSWGPSGDWVSILPVDSFGFPIDDD